VLGVRPRYREDPLMGWDDKKKKFVPLGSRAQEFGSRAQE
jgi:hypothetical protein